MHKKLNDKEKKVAHNTQKSTFFTDFVTVIMCHYLFILRDGQSIRSGLAIKIDE